ncbi:MAG: hypothetical protein AAF211_11905, partial [Myxococcota bacterium]
YAPLHVMLAVAVLHNWTPLVLVDEASPPAQRRWVRGFGLVAFGIVPLLVALGWGEALVHPSGLDPFQTGPLSTHHGAYLPPELQRLGSADRLFTAIVVAQCLHYAAVLLVLPRLIPRPAKGRSLWWDGTVVVASAGLLGLFGLDFVGARKLYGLASSVHAWIEVPVLLVCGLSVRPRA